MIYLEKGQKLFDNPALVVYDPTGYYNDGDSVICASAIQPEEPVCRYESRFIAYGGMVYSISDEDELLAEILKIDPKTLYGKDSKQVAVDKIVEQIVPQESGVVQEEVKDNQEVVEPVNENVATSTPNVQIPQSDDTSTTTPSSNLISTTTPETNIGGNPMSTTTPQINFPGDISTTSPETLIPVDGGTATTTPPEILFPDSDVSTTTPDILVPLEQSTTTPSAFISTSTAPVNVDVLIEQVSTTTDALGGANQ